MWISSLCLSSVLHSYRLERSFSDLEALRNALYKCSTYLLTYLQYDVYRSDHVDADFLAVVVWRRGSALVSINEVNLLRARLVLRWVIVPGFSFRCGACISVCDQKPSSTQPGLPFVGRRG